ncbi:MAG: CBS domain-containing protein [Gemmatimonas sp.]|jgi:putative hemolysin|uniref:CBS domain-containing protein n=1 Tax=Gemmatimonas sp. TaxID=1962908 RepID=UPI00391F488E|nr:CBS domain-containing protein [Gemmatimonadota bacterium]
MTALIMLLAVAIVGVLTLGATAIRAVSRLWLRHWIEHRSGGVGAMTRYLERPMRLVHAAGTASMLTVFTTGSILALVDGLRAWAFVRDVLLLLVLLLVCGQLLPRAIGRRWAASIVPVMVPLLRVVDLGLAPFHLLANLLRTAVTRPTSPTPGEDARDGLEELLRDGAFDDISTTEEMAIISGVVQFGDKRVRDVMRLRADLFTLPDGLPPMTLAQQVATSGYSRVPIFRESPDRIVGMVHVFEVFRRRGESAPTLRPVTFTTPDKSAKDLLFELLRARRQLAIVQDGETVAGLVTLEDLLEELVGDIRDEHDDNSD